MINNVKLKTKSNDILVLMWRYFINNKLGSIVFINKIVKENLYIDILRKSFTLFIEVLTTDGLTNFIFQQDNASPHKA